MRRGDIVIAAQSGAFTGKPRPFLIVQNDAASAIHQTITLCMITTYLTGNHLIRIPIEPTADTGLKERSEIETDKLVTLRRSAIGDTIGAAPPDIMIAVDTALRRWLSL